jgi:putative ABC transport system substrate-binding protein
MRRRDFITLLGGAAAAGSVTIPAMAQQPGKVPRVGILTPAENDATPIFDAFRKGLRYLGYVDGKTIVLDFRFAKGNIDALTGLAAELVRIPVDVIVADATPARAPHLMQRARSRSSLGRQVTPYTWGSWRASAGLAAMSRA